MPEFWMVLSVLFQASGGQLGSKDWLGHSVFDGTILAGEGAKGDTVSMNQGPKLSCILPLSLSQDAPGSEGLSGAAGHSE